MAGNLNPQQFDPQYGEGLFHGTYRDIKGGEIKPAMNTPHKKINFESLSNPTVAYATEDEHTAWALAASARGQNTAPSGVPGRSRVHVLEPNAEMRVGMYHPDHPAFGQVGENLAEWVAPKFKIKDTIDTQPEQQGTFPLNWNQFAKRDSVDWSDAFNHPTDAQIKYGHWGGGRQRMNMQSDPYDAWSHEARAETIKKSIEHQDQGRLF